METKTFSLNTVLSVTTGRLLTTPKAKDDNGISDLYKLLNHMTNDNLFTHQLGRAGKECKPWLLRWFPELNAVQTYECKLDEWLKTAPDCPDEAVKMWLTELKMKFLDLKDEYNVKQIPMDDHDVTNPFDELIKIRGTDERIIVLQPEADSD